MGVLGLAMKAFLPPPTLFGESYVCVFAFAYTPPGCCDTFEKSKASDVSFGVALPSPLGLGAVALLMYALGGVMLTCVLWGDMHVSLLLCDDVRKLDGLA
jgi:hypothetical protein